MASRFFLGGAAMQVVGVAAEGLADVFFLGRGRVR